MELRFLRLGQGQVGLNLGGTQEPLCLKIIPCGIGVASGSKERFGLVEGFRGETWSFSCAGGGNSRLRPGKHFYRGTNATSGNCKGKQEG